MPVQVVSRENLVAAALVPARAHERRVVERRVRRGPGRARRPAHTRHGAGARAKDLRPAAPGRARALRERLRARARAASRGRAARLRVEQPVGSVPAGRAGAAEPAHEDGGATRPAAPARLASATCTASRTRRWRRCSRCARPTTTPRYAGQAAHAAFALVDRLEQELSRFVANSDVSRVNELCARAGHAREPGDDGVPRDRPARLRADRRGLRRLDRHRARSARARRGRARRPRARQTAFASTSGASARDTRSTGWRSVLEEWEIERALVHGGCSSVLALEPPPGRGGWPLS